MIYAVWHIQRCRTSLWLTCAGNKIPSIENLAAALHNDALDLTDNALTSLSNFPLFPRITSLYCARNRINHIAPTLSRSLPKLQTLVLTENRFSNLSELVPLRACKKLIYLSLLENPIAAKEVSLYIHVPYPPFNY